VTGANGSGRATLLTRPHGRSHVESAIPGWVVSPLLRHLIAAGKLVAPLPDAHAARAWATESLAKIALPHTVEYSPALLALLEEIRKSMEATPA
jgi:hypothetical protein